MTRVTQNWCEVGHEIICKKHRAAPQHMPTSKPRCDGRAKSKGSTSCRDATRKRRRSRSSSSSSSSTRYTRRKDLGQRVKHRIEQHVLQHRKDKASRELGIARTKLSDALLALQQEWDDRKILESQLAERTVLLQQQSRFSVCPAAGAAA